MTINNSIIIELANQLDILNKYNKKFGDYFGYGCEFVFSGIEINSDNFDQYISDHLISLNRNWDTYLFYYPEDFKGLIFDFGYLSDKNKILAYDGVSLPLKYTVVREFTIEEFLKEYGTAQLFSVTHYRVTWIKLGFSWNN